MTVSAEPFAPRARARIETLLEGLPDPLPGGYHFEGLDLDQAVGIVLSGPHGPLYVELDLAAQRGYARSETFRITYQFPDQRGPLPTPVQAALDAVVRHIQARDTAAPPPPAIHKPAKRLVHVDTVLGASPNAETPWYVNPYVGCTVGCVYCNAQFRAQDVRLLDGRAGRPWGAWLDVKVNAPEVLRRELQLPQHRPGRVCFSPVVTDPYVAAERKHRVTRGCLEALADAGGAWSAVVLTRTDIVLDDAALLARLPAAAAGVSIPTEDDTLLRRLEPRALTYAARLDVLDKLRAAGLRTFAVVQPAFPIDLAKFVADLAPRVDAVRVDDLYERERVAHHFSGIPLADPRTVAAAFAAAGTPTDLSSVLD